MKKLILAVVIIILSGCATVQQPSRDMPDRMARVRIGMTHQEVEALIGKPTSVTKTDTRSGRLEICDYVVGTPHAPASSANLNENISMQVVYNRGRVLRVQNTGEIAPHHSYIKPSAGVHVDKNMVVTGVDVKSPAFKAGLKVSDIILAFDGITVSDIATLRKLTDAVAFGDKKVARIKRGNDILDLTIYYPQPRYDK